MERYDIRNPYNDAMRFVAIILMSLLGLLTSCARAESHEPGTVTVLLDEAPQNLDARIGIDVTSERMIQLMYGSLVKRSRDFAIEPDLALKWEIPDPLTYIFHLRDDAYFHDGRNVTAKDVVFTFRSVLDGSVKTIKGGTYRLVESVEAPDERTVIFKLKEPFAPFLYNLTRGAIGIVPDGSEPNLASKPVGSGAFKFVRYIPDGEVILERFDKYYGEKPHIQKVRFKIVPDAVVRALELRKGTVDIASNVLSADIAEALKDQPHLNVLNAPGTSYQYIAFNLKDPAFADLRVRKAIAHAIDMETIIKYLWRGNARLATGVIPEGNWAYEGNVTTYEHNPERARELLGEAGQTGLAFTLRTSTDETTRTLATVFQQQLKEVGITMTIQSNEPATFSADVEKGNFQAFIRRWVGGNNDPDIFDYVFHSMKTPPNGANRGYYINLRVDELVAIGRRETDVEKRKAAYQEIQRILAEELPYVNLFWVNNVAVTNKRIEGMTLYPSGEYEFLSEIRIREE
jgi:peptide/nickel transport system substrate-binding protein